MNPISQIELNAHFRDLERQVASSRQTQLRMPGWLRRLRGIWRPTTARATPQLSPAPAR